MLVAPLWEPGAGPAAGKSWEFGVVITMANGFVCPMQTVTGRTAPEPRIEYLNAITLGFAEIGLEWGWCPLPPHNMDYTPTRWP